MKQWQRYEAKILPRQYWRDERSTLFQTKPELTFFDDQPLEEFNQLIYQIKIGQVYKARNLAKEKQINSATVLRKNGDTILHVCAEYGQVKLFEDFHKRLPGDIDIKNKLDETPFCTAAREGRINILRMMYEKYPPPMFNADCRTTDGWTAFSYACINGFLNTITFLAENKANIHTSDRIKRTSLHWAARFNNVKVVQLLLNLGLSY